MLLFKIKRLSRKRLPPKFITRYFKTSNFVAYFYIILIEICNKIYCLKVLVLIFFCQHFLRNKTFNSIVIINIVTLLWYSTYVTLLIYSIFYLFIKLNSLFFAIFCVLQFAERHKYYVCGSHKKRLSMATLQNLLWFWEEHKTRLKKHYKIKMGYAERVVICLKWHFFFCLS